MQFRLRLFVLAGVPVGAVALGGATSPLALGLVVCAMGLSVLFLPPKCQGSPVFVMGAMVLMGWCAIPFLPAKWFGLEPWRASLESIWGQPLSATYSAQPWMTLEAWLLLGSGLVWAAWLMAQGLDERERALLLRIYLLGVVGLAVAGLATTLAGHRLPFWDGVQPGPFPNRNQSANVLALASMAGFSLGLRQLYHGRKNGWIWLGLTVVLLTTLAALGSRAGLVLFFAGAGGWLAWDVLESRKKSRVALGVTSALLLLAFLLLAGGEAVDRVLHSVESPSVWAPDTRFVLQRDAIEMAADQPVFGLGLGNFDGVFGLYRDHYRNTNRPIHPESDWVWWLCETGLPGLSILGGLLGWVMRHVWPREVDRDRRLRRLAVLALAVFVLHGMVDVPGHRMGSVLAVLFFLPLAMPVGAWVVPGRGERVALAVAGLWVFLVGLLLTGAALERVDWPGRSKVALLWSQAKGFDDAGRHAEALEVAREAQKYAPLDWRFHYQEGSSLLGLNTNWNLAERSFRMVRMLEPDSPYIPLEIGVMWLGRNTSEVLSAWKEALRRRDFQRPGFFQEMSSYAEKDPTTREALSGLTQGYPELDLFVLHQIPEARFDAHLGEILKKQPSGYALSEADITPFFQTWRQRRGDAAFLIEIQKFPAWKEAGWWTVARTHGALGQWSEAHALADRHLKPPVLPRLEMDEARARETARKHPDDLPSGLFLFDRALQEGNFSVARKRLNLLLALPEKPAYLDYLDSRLCLKEGHAGEAWAALERYRAAAPKG